MAMNNETGKIISYRRGIQKLSLSDVGNAIGYSAQAISRFEKGKVQVGMDLWGDLCKTLGISVRSFVQGDIALLEPWFEGKSSFDRDAFVSALLSKRLNARLQKNRLASELGINRQKISKWENGESLPSINEFKALADFYRLDYSDFYFSKEFRSFPLASERPLPFVEKHQGIFAAR